MKITNNATCYFQITVILFIKQEETEHSATIDSLTLYPTCISSLILVFGTILRAQPLLKICVLQITINQTICLFPVI